MTSGAVYPSHSVSIDPDQLCGDVTAGIVTSSWYTPGQYAFDPYSTSYQSSWNSNPHPRASVPELTGAPYAVQSHSMSHPSQAPLSLQTTPQHHLAQEHDFERPRSSPSTFGPAAENIRWPNTSGLGIHYTAAPDASTVATSAFPPGVFQNHQTAETSSYDTSTRPGIYQPLPRRAYTSIAPNPHGATVKRKREDEEYLPPAPLRERESVSSQAKTDRKRKRTSSVVSADLTEDDRFLVHLKQEENLPWKDIASRFQTEKGRTMQVAALQMRYKRLREKFRVWEEEDVTALKLAHEYWEKYKWEIISSKMLDFKVNERWPPRHCSRKWSELEAASAPHVPPTAANPNLTPVSLSQFSSPVEGPMHFAFMPLQ